MSKLAPYRKSITALSVAVLGWAGAVVASPSGPITGSEWIVLGTGIATALGVYTVANAR